MRGADEGGWPETMSVLAEADETPFAVDRSVVLRRDTGKNPGGGVCAGIARYLQVDVVFVRLAFILLTVGSGVGIPLYIAAYFLIPRAQPGERIGFALGSPQLRTARLVALLGTIALGLVATAVALLPNLSVEKAAPLALVALAAVVLLIWRLRR